MDLVVLDAWGSDRAPEVEISGALQAIQEDPDLRVLLVGNEQELRARLPKPIPDRLEILHAPERVTMHDKPTQALRTKKASSISIGLQALKDQNAAAFISAGNTGAVMAFSLFHLGRIPGIKRPAIGALFPTTQGFAMVLDVGANAQVKPQNLVEFALMGSVMVEHMLGIQNPRVGLLSIGEEETKGNEIVFQARELLAQDPRIHFVGYVEGNDVLFGKADVIVADGFTGNVMLKFGEGVISFISLLIRQAIKRNPIALLGGLLLRGALKSLKNQLDFEEYGGAPLIGLQGLVIIAHGRSSPRAIKNALLTGKRLHQQGVLEHLQNLATAS